MKKLCTVIIKPWICESTEKINPSVHSLNFSKSLIDFQVILIYHIKNRLLSILNILFIIRFIYEIDFIEHHSCRILDNHFLIIYYFFKNILYSIFSFLFLSSYITSSVQRIEKFSLEKPLLKSMFTRCASIFDNIKNRLSHILVRNGLKIQNNLVEILILISKYLLLYDNLICALFDTLRNAILSFHKTFE